MAPFKKELLELLHKVDKWVSAENSITLLGAGDTAMALLNLKAPSAHLDFVGNDKDISEFSRICAAIPMQGFRIHTSTNGMVFGHQLPDDYLKISVEISVGLARIDLRALHPLDIVVTKIERLSETDMRDRHLDKSIRR